MKRTVVAFGDSNTRYWRGDLGEPGPLSEAWPARLEERLPHTRVVNAGWPGGRMSDARETFLDRTAGADLTILAFGTNDIKLPGASLEDYLGGLEDILKQNSGRPLLVLPILWFGCGYGFAGAQARLPVWNAGLSTLCGRYGVPVWDTAPQFAEQEALFNDDPPHHLNAEGQARMARWVYEGLKKLRMEE